MFSVCVCLVTALGFSKGAPFSTCLTMFRVCVSRDSPRVLQGSAVLHLSDHVPCVCVCLVTALGFSKGTPFSTCLTMFRVCVSRDSPRVLQGSAVLHLSDHVPCVCVS